MTERQEKGAAPPRRPSRNRPKATTLSPAKAPAPRPADEPAGERRVTLAAVIGAHGLTGEVRLKLFTDDLSPYRAVMIGGRPMTLSKIKPGPSGAIARIAGIADRTAAEGLRGSEVTIPRSALPPLAEGEYYHADLIGLPVISTTGDAIGRVVAVENFGAGDVIEIERDGGATFMAPMKPDAVPEWSAERLVLDCAFIE